jgi:pimeloyl-ACP methyl ester carboxylesterase
VLTTLSPICCNRLGASLILQERVHAAEAELFAGAGVEVEEFYLALARTRLRARVLSHGSGPPLILLHGVTLGAAVWVPLLGALPDWRLLAIDLPGHGLSDPAAYRRGHVREHARSFIDDVLDALELDQAPFVGHSLGGMFALWYAATGAERISKLVVMAAPAVALPGARVRMPLSLLTVPGVGEAVLRAPSPRAVYRRLLAQGLGSAEVAAAPPPLVEALRRATGRPENARTVASLMHAINRFVAPRPESVLTMAELAAIGVKVMFIWGSDDPYLSSEAARPSIERIPDATLHDVQAGHGPWLVNRSRSAELIQKHLA